MTDFNYSLQNTTNFQKEIFYVEPMLSCGVNPDPNNPEDPTKLLKDRMIEPDMLPGTFFNEWNKNVYFMTYNEKGHWMLAVFLKDYDKVNKNSSNSKQPLKGNQYHCLYCDTDIIGKGVSSTIPNDQNHSPMEDRVDFPSKEICDQLHMKFKERFRLFAKDTLGAQLVSFHSIQGEIQLIIYSTHQFSITNDNLFVI